MKNKIIVSLLSLSLLSLELTWTRILSAEYFYTFAFLILSLAIFGMGLGALSLRIFQALAKKNTTPLLLSLTVVFALIGPSIAMRLNLDFSKLYISHMQQLKFSGLIVLLSLPFYSGGIVITKLFRENYSEMNSLYMADLIGAGIGVVFAVAAMNIAGTAIAAFLIILPLIAACFFAFNKWRIVPFLLLALFFVFSFYSNTLLDPVKEEHAPVILKHWDAMAKLKVFEYDAADRGIQIDNAANAPVIGFNGDWSQKDSLKKNFLLDFEYVLTKTPNAKVLVMGAGGGVDVLQALSLGAKEVHAVEVIPEINRMMTVGELSSFSGNIYKDPRVKVITEDVRPYVHRFNNTFDLMISVSTNTFASMVSGAFAMSETYVFTTDAFRDYYRALSDKGILIMEHQFYIPRAVTEALDALKAEGIKNPEKHIAVIALPQMHRHVLLFSKNELSTEMMNNAIGAITPETYTSAHLVYPAVDSIAGNKINQIVTKGWMAVAQESKTNLSPSTDDHPFIAQMGLLKNLSAENMKHIIPLEIYGFPLSKIIVSILLSLSIVLLLLLYLLSFFFKSGGKLNLSACLYFIAIGAGFMMIEVVLIQRYTLFLGASVYSFMTVLLPLLVGAGIGSKFSGRVKEYFPFILIILWVLAEVFVFKNIRSSASSLEFGMRVSLSVIFLLPLGFFMGMPFPFAVKRVGELVDWGFAFNGIASVGGSSLVLLLAFTYGLSTALLCSILFYALAWGILQFNKQW